MFCQFAHSSQKRPSKWVIQSAMQFYFYPKIKEIFTTLLIIHFFLAKWVINDMYNFFCLGYFTRLCLPLGNSRVIIKLIENDLLTTAFTSLQFMQWCRQLTNWHHAPQPSRFWVCSQLPYMILCGWVCLISRVTDLNSVPATKAGDNVSCNSLEW